MKKKLSYSAAVLGLTAVLAIPLMGFSAEAQGQSKIQPNQITLESGGTSVPKVAPIYNGEPKDGIISGQVACQPDLHEFDKGIDGSHIVFTAGIKEVTSQAEAANFVKSGSQIYVEITSNGQKVVELPFSLHERPNDNGVLTESDDPNTGLPFFVSAVHLNGDNPVNLPTGEYNYQFKAKDQNGHVLAVWAPKNHKFTITDSKASN
ncbi:MAG: hypothetical protein Q8912_15725 [Bacillota bacterium]|nr:hypothetical protein [Bacillota bacterium]